VTVAGGGGRRQATKQAKPRGDPRRRARGCGSRATRTSWPRPWWAPASSWACAYDAEPPDVEGATHLATALFLGGLERLGRASSRS